MKQEKTCHKCNKQYPPSTIFCPDCGSLTKSPEAPEVTPSANPVRAKRSTTRSLPSRYLPSTSPPPKVRTEYSRTDFFEALVKNNVPEQDIEAIRSLIEWSDRISESVSYGDSIAESGRVGFRPRISVQDKDVSLFWISTDGRIEIYFEEWIHTSPFDSREKRMEMVKKLNAINGVKISGDKIAARPPVPVKALREKAEMDQFIEIYEWFIGLVRGQ